ncbi:MAG: YsnF/AvaK domain-containing protein [Bacillus sp. (in: Bacteria)]|nr:YsnF/AvaK domain-containing protein [Bacillus sp. (in: firmicutes)]
MAEEKVARNQDVKLKLRKEQLDILKKKVRVGEVSVHKEVRTEEKTIVVPVTTVELVIERKVFDPDNPDSLNGKMEAMRIPISKELIEIVKHPTLLEDINIYKRKFQKIDHIKKTLKSEKIHVDTTGNAKVINKEGEKNNPRH